MYPSSTYFSRAIDQAMLPLTLSITIINTICWIIGGAFVFGAIVRYLQYRDNPSESPLGQVMFLALLGAILLLLPIIGQYALPMR